MNKMDDLKDVLTQPEIEGNKEEKALHSKDILNKFNSSSGDKSRIDAQYISENYYHAMLEEAIEIATRAHGGQVDKSGMPYILHPLHVMNQVETLPQKIVAVLHDVIEDTHIELSILALHGFNNEIIEAVEAITKKSGESYDEYIKRVKNNELAKRVKIEDIKHNMDLTRIPNPTSRDLKRFKKYKKALAELTEEIFS